MTEPAFTTTVRKHRLKQLDQKLTSLLIIMADSLESCARNVFLPISEDFIASFSYVSEDPGKLLTKGLKDLRYLFIREE